MRNISTWEEVCSLRAALAVRASSGWVLYEGTDRLAGEASEGLELSGRPGELVLRAAGANRLWRVTAWDERGSNLRLSVRGAFGRAGRVVWIARDGVGPLAWGPEWFEEAVCRALESRFGPDSGTLAARGGGLAGSVRVAAGRRAAVIALPPGASHADANGLLAAGLVIRARLERGGARSADLLAFASGEGARILASRLVWFRPSANIRLYDVTDPAREIRPYDQGSLAGMGRVFWPKPRPQSTPLVDRILAVAPEVLRYHHRPGSGRHRILLRGLECAVIHGDRASFGTGRRRDVLDEATWPRFEAFIRDLAAVRSAGARDRSHPAWRSHPERWLASLLFDDVSRIDPLLDPRVVYEQVPARRGDSREYLDLLAVTRTGRLAVIEIKADEDRALPLQGLDYWSRVRWHHAKGDVAGRGYFPGTTLDPRSPLLYLVAPMFSLHASVRMTLDLLVPEIDVVTVGINSGWRRGIRVLSRRE